MTARSTVRSTRQIGQLLLVGCDGAEMTSRLASLLTRIQPGGVILFARNIKNPQQTWRLLRDCQECVRTRLLTSIDLEGGSVDRLRHVLGPTPSAAEVFRTRDRGLFRKHGETIGNNCRALGFNVDFAPVVDLAFPASRQVMATRVVSANPRAVTAYAREFLAGLRRAKILGCGKHFPGLGEGALDSHQKLPVIDKALKKLAAEDLVPYCELAKQMPMVMVAHAAYPQVTGDLTPASLSPVWISEILRRRLGFKNLIVSDDLEMGGVLANATVEEAAVGHIYAGGDLCLVCHREENVVLAYEGLMRTAERDARFDRAAAEATGRVLAFKRKWARLLAPAKAPSEAVVRKLARKLWEFSEQVRLEALARREMSEPAPVQKAGRRRRPPEEERQKKTAGI